MARGRRRHRRGAADLPARRAALAGQLLARRPTPRRGVAWTDRHLEHRGRRRRHRRAAAAHHGHLAGARRAVPVLVAARRCQSCGPRLPSPARCRWSAWLRAVPRSNSLRGGRLPAVTVSSHEPREAPRARRHDSAGPVVRSCAHGAPEGVAGGRGRLRDGPDDDAVGGRRQSPGAGADGRRALDGGGHPRPGDASAHLRGRYRVGAQRGLAGSGDAGRVCRSSMGHGSTPRPEPWTPARQSCRGSSWAGRRRYDSGCSSPI